MIATSEQVSLLWDAARNDGCEDEMGAVITELKALRARNAELEKSDTEWTESSMAYVSKLAVLHERNAELEAYVVRLKAAQEHLKDGPL